jgi:CRP/FNR family transcriptional regulator, cyclic AMP receptor protein
VRLSRSAAETVLRTRGWLATQPLAFADALLAQALLQHVRAGEIVYRVGDPLGGMYGLASGVLGFDAAPPDSEPRRVHLGEPGLWTGEGPFLVREPRRIALSAIVETTLLHVPLKVLDDMAERDHETVRRVVQSLDASIDILIRVVHDLQQSDTDRRIAAVLHRASAVGRAVPLTQIELGAMANASRKQVNAALQKFAGSGWIETSYRSIRVVGADALRAFALAEGSE